MAYMIDDAHDTALESLSPLRAATSGLQYARRSYAASGAIIDELPFVEFVFTTLSVARYQAVLAQFGLTTANTAPVSIYIQDENYNWILRNGTAVKPLVGSDGQRDNYWLRSFTILVKDLRPQA